MIHVHVQGMSKLQAGRVAWTETVYTMRSVDPPHPRTGHLYVGLPVCETHRRKQTGFHFQTCKRNSLKSLCG